MGKPTGFMDFARQNNASAAPLERIKNFNEFHVALSEAERRKQGGRCMNCGVPYCQSGMMLGGMVTGCPLHNLIPEWNDEVYYGNLEQAWLRLQKTNSFPEFTGRVCPALCEVACICGLNDTPVTVKENELAIIENAFESGLIKSRPPQVRTDKNVAVIGSGPSGLACADRLNRRGHNVTVFEKSDRAGGLLMYGIPNMKLEKKVVERRVSLMEAEGISFITGADVGANVSAQDILEKYDAVVLCCGSEQPRDIVAEGREGAKGVYFAVDFLSRNTKSLLDSGFTDGKYVDPKGKHVVIVGGGDTGNDCVGTVIRHGCASVLQLEMLPKPPEQRSKSNPWPQYPRTCKTDYGQEEAIAVFGSDPRLYGTTVKKVITGGSGEIKAIQTVSIRFDENRRMQEMPGSEKTVDCDLLIIAAGFTGCRRYVADAFGVALTPRSTVDANAYATSAPKVFSAGDMRRGQSLVVWAINEGRECAKKVDYFLMGYSNM